MNSFSFILFNSSKDVIHIHTMYLIYDELEQKKNGRSIFENRNKKKTPEKQPDKLIKN